jgi:hypothetical protein
MSYPSPRSFVAGAAATHDRPGRVPNPQGPAPPLPNGISFRARDYRAGLASDASDGPISPLRVLRGGCYLARYTPLQASPTQPGAIYYLGTVRVQQVGATITVSGDLYLRRVHSPGSGVSVPDPDPGNGIPMFPIADYRYYLRATNVRDTPRAGESFTLGLEFFRFIHATASWANDGAFSAELSWTTSPPGYPSESDYLAGEVKTDAGVTTGSLTLGRVSDYLRRATIEIDRVPQGVTPTNNGAGVGFQQVFETLGWDLRVIESDRSVQEPTGNSWSDAEMHSAMLEWRERREALLDSDWRYHLLCVRRIDETERGIMYDHAATDSNRTPREGVGLACDWVYENEPMWGTLQGTRFGDDAATYFRTAIHELGHAMGLYHNGADNGFMNTTDVIARRAHPERPFPQNIRWAFNADDEKRLRHMPDIWVRPGGVQFGEDYSVSPISADDTIATPVGLQLVVTPVNDVIPLGAPARVDFTMTNVSSQSVLAPQNLSLRGGNVRGQVIDPSGTVRTFQPLVQCIEKQPLAMLAPQASVTHAATLLRGSQGALFPAGGLYRIVIEVRWDDTTGRYGLLGSTDLFVSAAESTDHAQAVYDVLANPELLVAIAASKTTGSGADAIRKVRQDKVLGPHYAWLDAKSACRAAAPAESLAALQSLSDTEVVMNVSERQKAREWVDRLLEREAPAQAPAQGAGAAKRRRAAKGARKGSGPASRARAVASGVGPADDMHVLARKLRQQLG